MATHSSILAWKILWTEEPRGYSPWGHKELGYDGVHSVSLIINIQRAQYKKKNEKRWQCNRRNRNSKKNSRGHATNK